MKPEKPIVVTVPTYQRPELLKRTLESWSEVRGVEDAVFMFHCEPGCPEVVSLCKAVDFAERHVLVNKVRYGHAVNVQYAMFYAFTHSDYAVLGLDDFLVSRDILELFSWHRENYQDDSTVLALTAGRDIPAPSGGLAAVWRCKLIGAVTGFHRRQWQILARRWGEATDTGWWTWVNQEFLQTGPKYDVLFPALSRAEDIGDEHPSSCWYQSPAPQAYYEAKGREYASGFTRWWEGEAE